MAHDPLNFLSGLSAKLATRSRHVCWLLGAGASRACGLPDVAGLSAKVVAALDGGERALFEEQLSGRNLEQALSRVRAIRALLSNSQSFDGFDAETAEAIDAAVCGAIVEALDTAHADLVPFRQFALWVRRSAYNSPIEIFTVNYDLLLEQAFDKHRVLYFDGFAGIVEARFQIELAEGLGAPGAQMPSFVSRLWKLHGSVNWSWDGREIVRYGVPVQKGAVAAIYPSEMKYEESRRFPFVVLQDRFRRSLDVPETLLLVAGYSFGDQHLNEQIFDAADRHQRSETVVFCFDQLDDDLIARASVTPNLQLIGRSEAVIGGVRAEWSLGEGEESEFFEDGNLLIPDFAVLAKFLAKSCMIERDRDPVVKELVALIAEQAKAQQNAK